MQLMCCVHCGVQQEASYAQKLCLKINYRVNIEARVHVQFIENS